MKKWKIIKGTEKDFEGAPEEVTVLISGNWLHSQKYWAEKFEHGSNFVVTSYPDCYPQGQLDGIFKNGYVVAERVEVEDHMAIPRGWLVNDKFTQDDSYAKWASKHGYEVIAIEDKNNKKDILDVILETSLKVQDRTEGYVLRKLNKEVGEVGEALLALAKYQSTDEPLSGEIADVIITVVDLLYVHYSEIGMSSSSVKTLIEEGVKRKTEKWIKKRGV